MPYNKIPHFVSGQRPIKENIEVLGKHGAIRAVPS